ncbi:MAG: hypothetical protein GYA58_08445 [Anaerolineaceae bacterium]|nr:hypothetical protein [Anaerolineaceae bacterium]
MNQLIETGKKNMIFGLLWFFGGGIATLLGFTAASNSGGRYYIFYGAVIAGIAQFFTGLSQYRKGKKPGAQPNPISTAEPGASVPPPFTTTPPAFPAAAPSERKMWKLGKRELLAGLIGMAIYIATAVVWNLLDVRPIPTSFGEINIYPATIIPIFVGLVFGPLAGVLAGGLGSFLTNIVLGYGASFLGPFSLAILGFVPGLIWTKLTIYKSGKDILLAEAMGAVGIITSDLFLAIYLAIQGFGFAQVFTQFSVSDAISALILLPLFLFLYGIIVQNARESV